METPVLQVRRATSAYGRRGLHRQVLAETSFELMAGESLAIVGPSGAGKTTLSDIILGLRPPASGEVLVLGKPWASSSKPPLRALRRLVQGVPQDPGASLIPGWPVRRSIELAIRRLTTTDPEEAVNRAAEYAHFEQALLDRRPSELSGGQAQRAAIARALAVEPAVLVADEPTSALDPETAISVAEALIDSTANSGVALLVVTHDPEFAKLCGSTLALAAPKAS